MTYVIGLLTGVLVAMGIFLIASPNCPTEDSCNPNYVKVHVGPLHFGFWTGEETQP